MITFINQTQKLTKSPIQKTIKNDISMQEITTKISLSRSQLHQLQQEKSPKHQETQTPIQEEQHRSKLSICIFRQEIYPRL